MSFEGKGRLGAAVETCRYAQSKLAFRGPKRNLVTEYVAFLGGTETYGKFVDRPFAQEIEEATGVTCVNLGLANAGIDVLLGDPGLTRIAAGAAMAVVQVPCAANLSNRYYKVHPRRNDRFVKAEPPLQEMFAEVDFTEFSFTRHMLMHLRQTSPERFADVRRALASAWVQGMRRLIAEIRAPVVLLWFSDRPPEQNADAVEARFEPVLVDREMLDAVGRDLTALVEVETGAASRWEAEEAHAPDLQLHDSAILRDLPDQGAHEAAAEALIPVLARFLDP